MPRKIVNNDEVLVEDVSENEAFDVQEDEEMIGESEMVPNALVPEVPKDNGKSKMANEVDSDKAKKGSIEVISTLKPQLAPYKPNVPYPNFLEKDLLEKNFQQFVRRL